MKGVRESFDRPSPGHLGCLDFFENIKEIWFEEDDVVSGSGQLVGYPSVADHVGTADGRREDEDFVGMDEGQEEEEQGRPEHHLGKRTGRQGQTKKGTHLISFEWDQKAKLVTFR